VIKTLPSFLLDFDVEPVDKITDIINNSDIMVLRHWYGITLTLSESKYKIRYNFMGSNLFFSFWTYLY